MKCAYCSKNTISPIRKFINKNVECSLCGKKIKYSDNIRRAALIIFVIFNYFNMVINDGNSAFKDAIFVILILAVVLVFMISPVDKNAKE